MEVWINEQVRGRGTEWRNRGNRGFEAKRGKGYRERGRGRGGRGNGGRERLDGKEGKGQRVEGKTNP